MPCPGASRYIRLRYIDEQCSSSHRVTCHVHREPHDTSAVTECTPTELRGSLLTAPESGPPGKPCGQASRSSGAGRPAGPYSRPGPAAAPRIRLGLSQIVTPFVTVYNRITDRGQKSATVRCGREEGEEGGFAGKDMARPVVIGMKESIASHGLDLEPLRYRQYLLLDLHLIGLCLRPRKNYIR